MKDSKEDRTAVAPAKVERLVICVRHRDGWCATKREFGLQYNDNVPTLCGASVLFPWGVESRTPDCPECLAIMSK